MSDASVAIIGAGPSGLIAAEILSAAGKRVVVYERMASVARKFLMAGRGGLNLTHSEPFERFIERYDEAAANLLPMLQAFTPNDLIDWANGLGAETFIGSSGRVFPRAMKASPLLRAWLTRLAEQGVEIKTRATWLGWANDGALRFNENGADKKSNQRQPFSHSAAQAGPNSDQTVHGRRRSPHAASPSRPSSQATAASTSRGASTSERAVPANRSKALPSCTIPAAAAAK